MSDTDLKNSADKYYLQICVELWQPFSNCGTRIPGGGSEKKHRGKSVRSWCDGSSDRSSMVDPLRYFSFQLVLHDWCTKGCGMYYPVCGMVRIKEPLLIIGKSRKEMFYLTTHSTHFSYGYMASDIW